MPKVGGRFVAALRAWFVAGMWGSIGGTRGGTPEGVGALLGVSELMAE